MSLHKLYAWRGAFAFILPLWAALASAALPIETIKLPPGFEISVFAENVQNARSMALGDKGTLFVGTRSAGKVYAIKHDGKRAQQVITIASGMNMPNGVAFRQGALYVAEVNRIWRYDNIEANLANPPKASLVTDKLPSDRHHGWKFIRFGPDGMLYVPVGAPCNICEPAEPYAAILRIKVDGAAAGAPEVFARGVRNSVGFDWHAQTKELWFTDNGRDSLGDDVPPCELNRAPKPGMHFGYPYCHGSEVSDPEFGAKRQCKEFTAPEVNFQAHVAPLGTWLQEHGVLALIRPRTRLVTHLDVNRDQVDAAVDAFAAYFARAGKGLERIGPRL